MTSGDIRVGDEFEIKVVVAELPDSDGDVWCDIPGSQLRAWIAAKALLAGRRIERPLQVGDPVRIKGDVRRLFIDSLSRKGEVALLVSEQGEWLHRRLADLEPAPASEGGGT